VDISAESKLTIFDIHYKEGKRSLEAEVVNTKKGWIKRKAE